MPDARPPVADWATDFDHTHPDYAAAMVSFFKEHEDDPAYMPKH